MSADDAHLIFVAGLSGSGKSTAMAALEDLGFYCVDNLPAQLVPQFESLRRGDAHRQDRAGRGCTRGALPTQLPRCGEKPSGGRRARGVFFLDCANESSRRYREPGVAIRSPEGSVTEGIDRERALLVDAASLADHRIDTTSMNVHQLKEDVATRVTGAVRRTVINLVSFGFRYGTPQTVELLFDASAALFRAGAACAHGKGG